MRTTLDIDLPVLEDLKRIQRLEKKTLGQIASSLLAQAIKEHDLATGAAHKAELDWFSTEMGARVDLADKDSVYQILDRE